MKELLNKLDEQAVEIARLRELLRLQSIQLIQMDEGLLHQKYIEHVPPRARVFQARRQLLADVAYKNVRMEIANEPNSDAAHE